MGYFLFVFGAENLAAFFLVRNIGASANVGRSASEKVQFVFLHILWNLGNVLKSYSVIIGDVENFLRAEQVGKLVKHDLCFEA